MLNLTNAELQFAYHDQCCAIEAICTVKTVGKTGVEMEALTGVNVALLTIYDMCKAVDKGMELGLSLIHICPHGICPVGFPSVK